MTYKDYTIEVWKIEPHQYQYTIKRVGAIKHIDGFMREDSKTAVVKRLKHNIDNPSEIFKDTFVIPE